MVLKTLIWLVHLAANQSSANEHTYLEITLFLLKSFSVERSIDK